MVPLTESFAPTTIRGIKLYKDNPFKFDFIMDLGESQLDPDDPAVKETGKKLIGYFLASLTIPEKNMWVNLSPYEKDRVIPSDFGKTEMGSTVLAQDYLLKQVAASIMYPEGKTGKEFWQKISTEALKQFGTSSVPVDTLNKVWIVPEKAVVYENSADNSVMVVKSSLTVMLEEDYLGEKYRKPVDSNHQLSNDLIRKVILPVLKQEVNEGKNFAQLRQIYNSLILAAWYKNNLKRSLLGQGYVDRNKTSGIDVEDKAVNQEIYQQYLKAFRKGVFNYIKEEMDPVRNEVVPKKYFSGGIIWGNINEKIEVTSGQDSAMLASKVMSSLRMFVMTVGLIAAIAGASLGSSSSASAATYDTTGTTAIITTGDTATNVIAKSPAFKALAKTTKKKFGYTDFQKLVNTGAVTLTDSKGNVISDPKWDAIQPGQRLTFDLNSLNGAAPIAKPAVSRTVAGTVPFIAETEAILKTRAEVARLQQQINAGRLPLQHFGYDMAWAQEYGIRLTPQPTRKVNTNWEGSPVSSVSFSATPASIAYIDWRMAQMQGLAAKPIQSKLPVNGLLLGSYNKLDLSWQAISSQGTSFNIVPSIPGRDLVTLGRIFQGWGNFGALSTANQIAGPLFAGQIMMELRNYAVTHKTRGQDMRYDVRKKGLDGIIQTFTVNVVPIYSFDQNNQPVTEYLTTVGLVDTVQAVFGKIDEAFGNTGFFGDSSKRFVAEDLGFQIKVNDYHQAFDYGVAMNTDANVIAIKVYEIQNPGVRHRKNRDHGWDVIEDGRQPLDSARDYYAATVKGFVLRYDPATGRITGQQVFTAPTFITDAFAKSMATDGNYRTTPLMQRQMSLKDLQQERKFLTGVDERGKPILAAVRHPVTGHIERFITDPRDLNTASTLTDSRGNRLQFVPGRANAHQENAGEIVKDYFLDEVNEFVKRWSSLARPTTMADKYGTYDLSGRPQLTSMPPELQRLLGGRGYIVDPGTAMKRIVEVGEQYSGVVYFFDGRIPSPLRDLSGVRQVKVLGAANGITANADGSFSAAGMPKRLTADTLVVVDAGGKVIGIVNPSMRLQQVRVRGLSNFGVALNAKMEPRALMAPDDGFTPAKFAGVVGQNFGTRVPIAITGDMLVKVVDGRVIEILEPGVKALQNQAVISQTLAQGGVQVEDQRTGKFIVFAKGNTVTAQQKALGVHTESELAKLLLDGQVIMVPVEGTTQMRFIILKEAPPSRLNELKLNYNEPPSILPYTRLASNASLSDTLAAHFQPQFPTVLGFDGAPFRGVTIDAQTFTESDIPKLVALGANTVRSYYPIPIDIVQKLVAAGITNIVVNLPLNANAYDSENLTSFWGGEVPGVDARISLTANNYLPYITGLKAILAGKAKMVVELLNEPNTEAHYPAWMGRPATEATYQELFAMIDTHARNIHTQVGRDVFVSTVLWDTPAHYALALATDVDGVGVNYYRHNASITGDVQAAYQLAGVQKPFYISEAGVNSAFGRRNQAGAVFADAQLFTRMGISATFMSLTDNADKRVKGAGEHNWGWYGKPVFRLMSQQWAGQAFTPPVVTTNSLAGINQNYVLIRWKPNSANGRETEWVTEDTLNKYAELIAQNAIEVLKIGPGGETVGRYVKIFNDEFELWNITDFDANLLTHVMVIRTDGSAEFITLDQLKDPQVHERVRQAASSIEMRNRNGDVISRVYLDRNMEGSRIELIQGDKSRVYELKAFSPTNLTYAVSEIVRTTDATGLLHVTTTDLREVNRGVVVEDVYQTVPNAKPVLIYSVRALQKETIFFNEYGHERYSVSTDIASEPGQTVVIDGRTVEHVTGIFEFDRNTGVGVHVSLRDIQNKNWRASVRVSTFRDGQIIKDQTGFVTLQPNLSGAEIMARAKGQALLNKQEIYTYDELGKVTLRQVSIRPNGDWREVWTIKGGAIAPQPVLVSQLTSANSVIADAFKKYGLDANTSIIIETFIDSTQGVRTTDYRIAGDVQERKFITVTEQGGVVMNIVVGLDFDKRTGQQTLSYELTKDLQVKFLRQTVDNNSSVRQLLPSNIAAVYNDLTQRRLNGPGNIWEEAAVLGVTPEYVPVKVKKIPFLIDTDSPDPKGYRAIEQQAREMMRQYIATDSRTDRNEILDRIEDLVRAQYKGKAHYTRAEGEPTFHYLFPNDSRDRDFIEVFPNGEVLVNLWWLEGHTQNVITDGGSARTSFPPNALPGSMVVNASGSLQRATFFNYTSQMAFRDGNNVKRTMTVNGYSVVDAPFLQHTVYTASGQLVSEATRYVRARVINGMAGVQTRGTETIYYDIFSPYPVPFYGLLDEDNRVTKVSLNGNFKGVNAVQQIVNSSLENEPTAPGVFKVKTQTIINGTPVEGSRYEEDAFRTYWSDIISHWKIYLTMPALFSVIFSIGGLIGKRRLDNVKKKLAQEEAANANQPPRKTAKVPSQAIPRPDWRVNYGFSRSAVYVAYQKFEGSILPALENGKPLREVLDENFEAYRVWRKNVMGIDEPFTPTMEDLWIKLLLDVDGNIFSADMPDGLNYLFHKSIDARKEGKAAGIGGFVRKEYTRWNNILALQQTTFQGAEGGTARNVVPYAFYLNTDDLNDMFLNRAQIKWYDDLGYSLDGEQDMRDAIYADFTSTLAEKVTAVKDALQKVADSVDRNIGRIKKRAKALPEYQDYINFFSQIQKGQYHASEAFSFDGAGAEQADALINGKPVILKTYSEPRGGFLSSLGHLVRNSYNQLTYAATLTFSTGLTVAAFSGFIGAMPAAILAGLTFIALKALYIPLSWLMDRNLSTAFGKTVMPWIGYDRLKATKEQVWYRRAFWGIAIPLKVAWDSFLFHYFLIPHMETIGSTWYPHIAGFEIPLSMNFLLMTAMWATSTFFLVLSSWASYWFVGGPFSYLHAKVRGLGTIKTPADIRTLQKDDVLNRLIEQKLLPDGGRGMDAAAKEKARRAIMNFIFYQMRMRDDISDEEWRAAYYNGSLDKFASEELQKRVATFVNSMTMDMPKMPHFDDIESSTILTPMYGEDVIYAYDETVDTPTSLDVELNTGYTNLNYIISRYKDRWANFIERAERDGIASADEIARMKRLLTGKGKLGALNDELKMQVRLWATYGGQGFARTLDGTMNYVRFLQLAARISHPEWDEATVRSEANKKFQMLWAYQVWGDLLNAPGDAAGKVLKRDDALYLLKKYYDELGFQIDIASLQRRGTNGIWHKVWSRYDGPSGKIKDIDAIELTANNPITLEGKPANQMHAGTFVKNTVQFTVDMNQDIPPEQAVKMAALLREYEDPEVAVVNFPEEIITSGFSLTGLYNKVADRTWNSSEKRRLSMLVSAFHHGHPDGWRASIVRQFGGVSSTTSISEDYIGGLRLALKGKKIKNVEYIEFGKAREVSWPGSEGIERKFAMGGGQAMVKRFARWADQRLGPLEGAAAFYGSTPFYFKEAISAIGLLTYAVATMVLGISAFAAFPVAIVSATAGVLVVGQSITITGFYQMANDDGIWKAIKTYTKIMPLMAPFFIAHIFTRAAGFLSGALGVAWYVATGRGFGREHLPIDKVLKSYSKSHIIVGVLGLALTAIAIGVWWNWTVVSSILTILSFVFPAIVPFVMNPGNYPVNGVSAERFLSLFKSDQKRLIEFLKENYNEGIANKDYGRAYGDTTIYAVAGAVWWLITAPVALVTSLVVKMAPKPAPAPVPVPSTRDAELLRLLTSLNRQLEEDRANGVSRRDQAMTVDTAKGGIDLGKTSVTVETDGKGVTTAFDDPALLQLLMDSDGLMPVIYEIQPMTPPMLNHLLGLNTSPQEENHEA